MKTIGQMWDEKFSREGYFYGLKPNVFIESQLELIKGNVLCLGEGEGRNAVFLASKGYQVTALDASPIGISKALHFADRQEVKIIPILVDLEQWEPNTTYNTIVSSYLHLEEPLRTKAFRTAIDVLEKEGYFIAEFFSINQMPRESGGPKKPELLYTLASLESIFSMPNCEIIYLKEEEVPLDEGPGHQGDALVIRVIVKKL